MSMYGEKFINSDDILARIDELGQYTQTGVQDEITDEIDKLRDLVSEADLDNRGDIVFYREDYFPEAMEDDAYDFGFIQRDSPVANYVDWEGYAEGVQVDYREYEIAGTTYLARA